MGAGSAEGAVDAANILKPALARNNLKLIGATTLDEYRKNIGLRRRANVSVRILYASLKGQPWHSA